MFNSLFRPRSPSSDHDLELPLKSNGTLPSSSRPVLLSWFTRRYLKASLIMLTSLAAISLALRLLSPYRLKVHVVGEASEPPESFALPPLYDRFHRYELQLPQHELDPPDAKYLWMQSHATSSGWGNVMQDLLLNAYLTYRSGRTFVWYNYTWNTDGSEYSTYNGKPIPSRITLSALLDGPIVGQPVITDPYAPQPMAIVKEHFDAICPEGERRQIMNNDVLGMLGHESTAGTLVEKWAEVLSTVEEKCVELPQDSYTIFDIWIMGDARRLLDVWPGFSTSPILREFRWSPLVELAFDMNTELIAPSTTYRPFLTSTPFPPSSAPGANPSAARYTPLPGLLVLHVRRGDFEGHCQHLGRYSSSYVGFNSFEGLVDRFDTSHNPSDEEERIAMYRGHCFPDISEIVRRAEEVRVEEEAEGRGVLRDVYVMTNGPAEWVEELKAAFNEGETGRWRNVASSRDLLVTDEQKYVKQAVDMLIGQRAQVFIGNGFSSMSGLVTMLRTANGIDGRQTRFF